MAPKASCQSSLSLSCSCSSFQSCDFPLLATFRQGVGAVSNPTRALSHKVEKHGNRATAQPPCQDRTKKVAITLEGFIEKQSKAGSRYHRYEDPSIATRPRSLISFYERI